MVAQSNAVSLKKVLEGEEKVIQEKRQKYHPEDQGGPSFGIALSGGGIRSATVNLGVLEVLNACQVLSRADYLSSVSGGGYIGGYVHAKIKQGGSASFQRLFAKKEIDRLRNYGFYLTPGKGLFKKLWNYLRMFGAVTASLLMNWVWVIALFGILVYGVKGLYFQGYWYAAIWLAFLAGIVLAYHYFFHGLRHLKLWSSDKLNYLEGVILILGVFLGGLHLANKASDSDLDGVLISLFLLLVTGWFANPNILSLHRFYRDRLAGAFLETAGTGDTGLKLAELRPDPGGGWAPYPLINTCLNLFNLADRKFRGTKSSDYFLLSPLYCGSLLTGYTETRNPGYSSMTLATAVAVSGAAVNPHMGNRSNRAAAFLLTLLNLRLGYWAVNPGRHIPWPFNHITWWPYYNILELFSKKDTQRWRVNLSDGGHIENLAVYELLRRGCRLIIAVDASADPRYAFEDLKNLVIRARNELGLAIDFRQAPETFIRPQPSQGFSRSHFVTATITDLPGKGPEEQLYKSPGLLIYLKSSMRAPGKVSRSKSASYRYKTYHPAFPHESTADQFFDPDQWGAYYHLGRFMAGDLLGIKVTEEAIDTEKCRVHSIQELLQKFQEIDTEAALKKLLSAWDQELQGSGGISRSEGS